MGWAASIGDWLVSGLGSNFEPSIGATREPLYGGGAGSTAYDPTLYAEGFDWHKAALEPVNFFFVDLASFLYGFLLVFALLVLVYTVILGALSTYGGAKLGPSFAFRAALIRGVEHTLVGAFAGALTWVGVGLRIGADFYAGAY